MWNVLVFKYVKCTVSIHFQDFLVHVSCRSSNAEGTHLLLFAKYSIISQ